jgi:hypothetical protein
MLHVLVRIKNFPKFFNSHYIKVTLLEKEGVIREVLCTHPAAAMCENLSKIHDTNT